MYICKHGVRTVPHVGMSVLIKLDSGHYQYIRIVAVLIGQTESSRYINAIAYDLRSLYYIYRFPRLNDW